ncbi:BCCT family transporter [Salinimonas sediminis]|uniref:BCCT family transporter n=1 Tax=Salinimonas sediminis TaxID=2303538 RepID=A0A346NMW7_9ALTE|nr:choline BCCT transporter BetT [Salinimonas sediminis]AXR06874.1 BCCT family transporter [Salinimonas sediminis]
MSSEDADKGQLNKKVFITSSLLIAALMIFAASGPEYAGKIFQSAQDVIVTNGSWFYVGTVAIILLLVVYLGVSRFGEMRLGPDHAKPEFSMPSWISMLFAAGMGIGLMFFGVAEPIMHFQTPPTADPGSVEAVREAMKTTFFHWGVHAWAIYAIVALVLGYFAFRHNLPLTMRSALYPLIGDRIYGWPGHIVDIFAVTSTIFGVATSLGLGAAQINAGLSYVFGIPNTNGMQIGIMAFVVLMAIVSVATGLEKGIRRLSETNMVLAILLLLFVFVAGPTVFLLQAYLQNTGAYLSDIVRNTLNLFAYDKTDWIGGWTIFYWGWWLAWAPFVGLFIARVSYGRTIREFIFGVLLIPTAFTLLWMTIFGNTAIDLVYSQGITKLSSMVSNDSSVALFVFLENFPWSSVVSMLAVVMVFIFFVTSCDSGAMVVDMLCSHGSNNTPLWQRIYWAVAVGVVASILLYAGGLDALQTMTIISALPFSIILLIAMYGLLKALRLDGYKRDSLQITAMQPPANETDKNWRDRLVNIVSFPNEKTVRRFMEKTAEPALREVGSEFETQGFTATLDSEDQYLRLTVSMGDERNFVYAVYMTQQDQPEFMPNDEGTATPTDQQSYYRAEVHLGEGGQNYDIVGWSKLAIINDVIDHYHKHQHFLHLMK